MSLPSIIQIAEKLTTYFPDCPGDFLFDVATNIERYTIHISCISLHKVWPEVLVVNQIEHAGGVLCLAVFESLKKCTGRIVYFCDI